MQQKNQFALFVSYVSAWIVRFGGSSWMHPEDFLKGLCKMVKGSILLLQIVIAILSGGTPPSWVWAYYAPNILLWQTTPFKIWGLAIVCYAAHGMLIELLPFNPLQPKATKLPLSVILPQVAVNLGSCVALVLTTQPSRHASDMEAILYLLIAAFGNEITYACIHRLLHTKALYKYHSLHHTQKAPRALGAAYCSLVEMWVANLASFLVPLSLTNAPIQIYLIWILCGIQTTQIHHSSKKWPWPFSMAHQPQFHDDHHRYVRRNFGNIGILESLLKKPH